MSQEQWLVYIWSIYPDGGFQAFYIVCFIVVIIFLISILISHTDKYTTDKKKTIWSKMGKWKVILPSTFLLLSFLCNLVPSRNYFAYIIATPYVVDSGKSLVESLNEPNSKLFKLNQIMDKGLDKILLEVSKDEKLK